MTWARSCTTNSWPIAAANAEDIPSNQLYQEEGGKYSLRVSAGWFWQIPVLHNKELVEHIEVLDDRFIKALEPPWVLGQRVNPKS